MKDITDQVEFSRNDDEHLPLTKCVCGEEFLLWSFIISLSKEDAQDHTCPKCGRGFFFSLHIRIYEVVEPT